MKVSSYFKFGGKVQKATSAAFLFYRETESDEELEYTSQNISFDVIPALADGRRVGSENRVSSSNGVGYTVWYTVPFTVSDESEGYSGATYEAGEYDVFCIPRFHNAGMFASVSDAENGIYQENVYDYAGDGGDEAEQGGRRRPGDPNILTEEVADAFWAIVDESVPDAAFLDPDNCTLVDVSADVFFNNMWTPEGGASVQKEVSGWALLIRSSPTSGFIFKASAGIRIGDDSHPIFFDITSSTPPDGDCNLFFAKGLASWDADFWERTTDLRWKYNATEDIWGYQEDEDGDKTIPGSMHGQTFGLSGEVWWAANIDPVILTHCGNLPGKNTYYGGGFDYENEPYFNLIDDFDLRASFVEPTIAGHDIYGLFGARVAVGDIAAISTYLEGILSRWGVAGKKIVFIAARTRWGCGDLGVGGDGAGLPEMPPELLEHFEVPTFSGRFAEVFVQLQMSGAVHELKLPIRFFHRPTKLTINNLPTSGGSEFDYIQSGLSEPFAGFVDMVSATKAVVRIYYEPNREWFSGGKRIKERHFDVGYGGGGGFPSRLQPFGFVGGFFSVMQEAHLSGKYRRVNPKRDYYRRCKVFEVAMQSDGLAIMSEADLTYPAIPNYPNLSNNSEATYIINDFELFGDNLQFTDSLVKDSENNIDNTRDFLFSPPDRSHFLYLGMPGYFQVRAFGYDTQDKNLEYYGINPGLYPERLTALSEYSMTDKILFNLLGKPYCNYEFRLWTGTYEQYDIYKINGNPESPIGVRPYDNKLGTMPGMFDVAYRPDFLVSTGRTNTGWGGHWLIGLEINHPYWDSLYWEFANFDEQRRGSLTVVGDSVFWVRIKEVSLPFMFTY